MERERGGRAGCEFVERGIAGGDSVGEVGRGEGLPRSPGGDD